MDASNSKQADSPPPSAPSSPSKADAEKQKNSQSVQVVPIASSPPQQQQQQQQQPCRGEDYRKLFHLPADEVLIQDFNCAFQKKILLQGHMYLFERYICFYSNIFGFEKKKVLPLRDVAFVRKGWTAGLFPNALEIGAWGKKYFFASFLSRDEAYKIIVNGWARHSFHARAESSLGLAQVAELAAQQTDAKLAIKNSEAVDIQPACTEDGEEKRVIAKLEQSEHYLKSSSFWNIEDAPAPPVPPEFKPVMECEFPVDVEDFFQLFFSDNAIDFAEAFHKSCGDEEFKCTLWASHPRFGFVRDISFRHPVNLYFGPKSAMCNETQKLRVYRGSHLVIETSQQMSEIPYSDYFHVEVRWDVERLPKNICFHSTVRISVNVVFSKKTLWKAKIEQGTMDECKETFSIWVREAYNVLSSKANSASSITAGTSEPGPVSASGDGREEHSSEQEVTRSRNKYTSLLELEIFSAVTRGLRKCKRAVTSCVSNNPMVALVFAVAILAILVQGVTLVAVSQKTSSQSFTQPQNLLFSKCVGGSSGSVEAITWLEQRARLVKEEIALSEARLQSLSQDLSMLKLHVNLFEQMKYN